MPQALILVYTALTAEGFLESLRFDGSEKRFHDIARPKEGTLIWIWDEDSNFTRWLEQENGLFWITGKPGSGKSTLMKDICWRYRKSRRNDHRVVAGYFFDNRGNSLQHSFKGLLQSALENIIRQEPGLFNLILEKFKDRHDSDDTIEWDVKDLKAAFEEVIINGPSTITLCWFIDALDECDDLTMKDFASFFKHITEAKTCGLRVKICFSGRNIPEALFSANKTTDGFVLHDKTSFDIVMYVDERLTFSGLSEDDDKELKELKTKIIRKADGIFLWVKLVLSELERGYEHGNTVSELRESLLKIPDELNGLFDDLVDKIDQEYIIETNAMLSLVLCATRPLTLSEFRFALAFSGSTLFRSQTEMEKSKELVQNDMAMTRRIRSRCGGLLEAGHVEATERSENLDDCPAEQTVQFIHQAVKDYLVRKGKASESKIYDAAVLLTQGHELLARSSIRYLRVQEVQALPSCLKDLHFVSQEDRAGCFTERLPFLNYSTRFWFMHATILEQLGSSQVDEMDEFGEDDGNCFDTWKSLYMWYNKPPQFRAGLTAMTLAVRCGLIKYVEKNIKNGIDVNTPLGYEGQYLQLAASEGNEDMVDALLALGADVNARGGQYDTALQAAASCGNERIVKTLLAHNADTAVYGGRFGNALCAAAFSGSLPVIKALLECGKEHYENSWAHYNTMLFLSLGSFNRLNLEPRNSKMVFPKERAPVLARTIDELSLEGIDTSFLISSISPVLLWTFTSWSEPILKIMIENGAGINDRGPYGCSLLLLACKVGSIDSVRFLLERGADYNAETYDGGTALHAACHSTSEDCLIYMMSLGLDPNVVDHNGYTPLMIAASNGRDNHVEILLDNGADVTAVTVRGNSVLHLAMVIEKPIINARALERMLDGLVPAGININTAGCEGETPLHIAAGKSSLQRFQWAIAKGADVHALDGRGRTVLHAAAANCGDDSEEIILHLLEQGLDLSSKDDGGNTPLHQAFLEIRNRIRKPEASKEKLPEPILASIRLMLLKGADINAQDDNGNTVLHIGASIGSKAIVRFLLQEGADRTLEDHRGFKPVDMAMYDDIKELLEVE